MTVKLFIQLLFSLIITMPALGSAECVQCHQKEVKEWETSHHSQSMQLAGEGTVLGDFDHATFDYYGDVTTFYKKDDQYFINTVSPNGAKQDYVVKYTFGVYPLQQYLIELSRGRLQAFTIAWNAEKNKWFHLHPDDNITAEHSLHWSKQFYNWNSNCAKCHSTNLQKQFDPTTKSYDTIWSDINVGCQACHGPGELHEEWANDTLAEKAGDIKNKGFTKSHDDVTPHQKIEMCASCHSRRHEISAEEQYGEPFFDHYMPALLRDDLYHPDGQIKDEVFEYGSFLQSKMYRAGVSCSDCHNPHSLEPKQVGNALCTQCHNDNASKQFSGLKTKNYDSPTHSHHKPDSAGSQCVECHMPEKAYMQIDFRRDHSFRLPRPDLTEKIGTPNACNQCHTDKSAAWASNSIQNWFGKQTHRQHYGEIFTNALSGKQEVEIDLINIAKDQQQAEIVRATAIQFLTQLDSPQSIKARVDALASDHVLVRMAAVRSLAGLPVKERIAMLSPYLNDPVRAVRVETASVLATVPKTHIPTQYHQALALAVDEYTSLQEANLDLPSSHFNLGNLYQSQGDVSKAIQAYQLSIDVDKSFYPAYQNLATLLHMLGQNSKAMQVLSDGISYNKEQGELYYSLGLLLAEQNEMDSAITALARAAALLPNNSRVLYNYALALQSRGDFKTAESILLKAYELDQNDPDIIVALSLLQKKGSLFE